MIKAYLVNYSGARQGEAAVSLVQVLPVDAEHVTIHFGPAEHPLANTLELVVENEEALDLADAIYKTLAVNSDDSPDDTVTPTVEDNEPEGVSVTGPLGEEGTGVTTVNAGE